MECLHLSADVRATFDNDGAVLLNVKTGRCYVTNGVGAMVLQRLGTGTALGEIIHDIAHICDVKEAVVQRDVDMFVRSLMADKLVVYAEQGCYQHS